MSTKIQVWRVKRQRGGGYDLQTTRVHRSKIAQLREEGWRTSEKGARYAEVERLHREYTALVAGVWNSK